MGSIPCSLSNYFRRNLQLFLFAIFFLFLNKFSLAQNDLNFTRLGVNDGLSQNTIFDIIQDHNGFMWFGTHDGLNKYDNYQFTTYKHIQGDSTSISDNIVNAICQSQFSNDIWVGTNDGGLCKFDYDMETFTSYQKADFNPEQTFIENTIKNIVEDKNGLLWINYDSYGGVSSFNPQTLEIKHFPFNPNYPLESGFGHVYLHLDSKGILWASSKKGLYKFEKNTGLFKKYIHNQSDPKSIPSNLLSVINEDENYCFWIGSDDGLIHFNPEKEEFKIYQNQKENPFSISSNKAYMALRDKEGKLWIATRNGLNQFNDSTEQFWSQQHNPINNNSLSSNNLSKLYLDKSGVLWIGTYEDGLNKYDTQGKKFVQYTYNPKNPNGIPQKTVRSIYEDRYGIIWVGFINGGVVQIDPKLNTYKRYDLKPPQKTASDPSTISAIYEDHEGTLWLGSWENGLAKASFKGKGRNREIGHYQYFPMDQNDPYSLSHASIQFIFEDSNHRLWIGTAGGLDIYDRKNNRFKHITYDPNNSNSLSDYSIQNAIVQSSSSSIWVGTWNGLNKLTLNPHFDRDFEKTGPNINELIIFDHYYHNLLESNSLNDNRITSLCLNNDGSLWVGQHGGGINRMAFLEDGMVQFSSYTEKNGLSNNVVYKIFNDDKGDIWCSTNNGISHIKTKEQQILEYHKIDGLISDEFFWGAGFKSKSGEMFLGGNNGFNAFYPSDIKDNNYQSPIVFTNFQVFNKKVKPGNKILSKNISEETEIHLNWSDKVFSIEFSSLHYSSPKNIQYKYQLIGFDQDWIPANYYDRMITYTNLNPGDYEFRVRATNSDGIWNQEYQSIRIFIKPPFWETWLFRIFAVLLVTGLVYLLFVFRISRVKRQKRILEVSIHERTKHIEHQKAEIYAQNEELTRLNKNKEKLVSILSHDLKGPISSTMSLLNILEDDWSSFSDHERNDMLKRIKRHAQSNLELIDDSLEFVRLGWDKITPNIKEKSISTTLKLVESIYLEAAHKKNIHLIISGDMDERIETDHDILKHILMNFTSNAIKFTPKSKTIEIKVQRLKKEIKICTIDQGIGIPKEKLDDLFNEMNTFSRIGTEGEKSHGIGLQLVKEYAHIIHAKINVESRVNEGSQFCLLLPMEWSK